MNKRVKPGRGPARNLVLALTGPDGTLSASIHAHGEEKLLSFSHKGLICGLRTINEWNDAEWNCWMTVNAARSNVDRKLQANDIRHQVAMHVSWDCTDPQDARYVHAKAFDRMDAFARAGGLRPNAVISAGLRVDAVWLLETPVKFLGDVGSYLSCERGIRDFAGYMGGDNKEQFLTAQIPIPNLVYWPSPQQKAAGFSPAEVVLLEHNRERSPLSSFDIARLNC